MTPHVVVAEDRETRQSGGGFRGGRGGRGGGFAQRAMGAAGLVRPRGKDGDNTSGGGGDNKD